MCGSVADIQSATAEIRRGKKEGRRRKKKKKEETTGRKHNGLPYYKGGRNKVSILHTFSDITITIYMTACDLMKTGQSKLQATHAFRLVCVETS